MADLLLFLFEAAVSEMEFAFAVAEAATEFHEHFAVRELWTCLTLKVRKKRKVCLMLKALKALKVLTFELEL